MISFYYLTHRFKRSLLEITSESPFVYYWDPDPLSKERLPNEIVFKIAIGKKAYDIIRRYEDRGHFFHKKILIFCLNLWICLTNVIQ